MSQSAADVMAGVIIIFVIVGPGLIVIWSAVAYTVCRLLTGVSPRTLVREWRAARERARRDSRPCTPLDHYVHRVGGEDRD